MDLIKLAIDPHRELHGARVHPWDDETFLIIARYNNPAFRKMQNDLMEPYLKEGGVDIEQAEEILSKCMAHTICLGWGELRVEGKLVEYSPEQALEYFADPRLADFKETVMMESQRLDHYRLQSLEEDLGNSERSLAIAQDGA